MFEDSIISECSTLCPSNMNWLCIQNRKAIDTSSLQSISDLQRWNLYTAGSLLMRMFEWSEEWGRCEIMSPPQPFPIIPSAAVQLSQLDTAETDASREWDELVQLYPLQSGGSSSVTIGTSSSVNNPPCSCMVMVSKCILYIDQL